MKLDNTGKVKLEVDRSRSLSSDAFVFAKSDDWQIIIDPNKPKETRIEGPPGTWAKHELLPPNLIALTRCPNCKTNLGLLTGLHTVDKLGKVLPDYKCPSCTFHRQAYLDEYNDKILYACAIERRIGRDWKPELVYTHASTQVEAQYQLGPVTDFRIVAIGRAIGFKALDDHGERLLA